MWPYRTTNAPCGSLNPNMRNSYNLLNRDGQTHGRTVRILYATRLFKIGGRKTTVFQYKLEIKPFVTFAVNRYVCTGWQHHILVLILSFSVEFGLFPTCTYLYIHCRGLNLLCSKITSQSPFNSKVIYIQQTGQQDRIPYLSCIDGGKILRSKLNIYNKKKGRKIYSALKSGYPDLVPGPDRTTVPLPLP